MHAASREVPSRSHTGFYLCGRLIPGRKLLRRNHLLEKSAPGMSSVAQVERLPTIPQEDIHTTWALHSPCLGNQGGSSVLNSDQPCFHS
jgi:hypothetical protein